MALEIENTEYLKVSKIEPQKLRSFLIYEVGEKSKEKLYNHLKDLTESYPDFDYWFDNIVIPELELKNGEREIILALSNLKNESKAIITGIAILKKTSSEKKICTFRVCEDYRNLGIGTKLFEFCFDYLETRKPIISISSNRKKMFEKHIVKYGFEEMEVLKDYYKKGSTEYVYNGKLKKNIE